MRARYLHHEEVQVVIAEDSRVPEFEKTGLGDSSDFHSAAQWLRKPTQLTRIRTQNGEMDRSCRRKQVPRKRGTATEEYIRQLIDEHERRSARLHSSTTVVTAIETQMGW